MRKEMWSREDSTSSNFQRVAAI